VGHYPACKRLREICQCIYISKHTKKYFALIGNTFVSKKRKTCPQKKKKKKTVLKSEESFSNFFANKFGINKKEFPRV
jgi:hypothetical protein